jgi:hypothetical protein
MVVSTPQDGEEIHVSNEGRLSAKRRLVGRFDVLAPVKPAFIALARSRVGVDEHVQLRGP